MPVVQNPWFGRPGQFYQMPMYPQSGGMPPVYQASYPPMNYGYGMLGGMMTGPSRIQDPYQPEAPEEDELEE